MADLKDYQLLFMSASSKDMPPSLWSFPDCPTAMRVYGWHPKHFSFQMCFPAFASLSRLSEGCSSSSKLDQSEFLETHLLDAQKFYMANEDPCLHGVSELYRVHCLIATTIEEIKPLQSVVDLGYYSCGIFNVGLTLSSNDIALSQRDTMCVG